MYTTVEHVLFYLLELLPHLSATVGCLVLNVVLAQYFAGAFWLWVRPQDHSDLQVQIDASSGEQKGGPDKVDFVMFAAFQRSDRKQAFR
jgi:hypothetical protein